jgi:uncharacterized membrane protein YdbT with pleckstrin-like domain
MAEFHLESGETITASVRTHWFVLLMEFMPFLLLAFLPIIIPDLFSVFSERVENSRSLALPQLDGAFSNAQFFLGLWWLFLWMGAFHTFTRYFLNHWIITTTRIVYIRQHGFFSREVSSFLLARVQDVTTEISGLVPTLLNYGTLSVETAGDGPDTFKMQGIPHPTKLRDLIMNEIAALHAHPDKGILRRVADAII